MNVTERCNKACAILEATHDGDDLDPLELAILERAVNGQLSPEGYAVFDGIYQSVVNGTYQKPSFHDIEHMTIDHTYALYWKDIRIEQYHPKWAFSEEAKKQTEELARRARIVEARGGSVSFETLISAWEEPDAVNDEN